MATALCLTCWRPRQIAQYVRFQMDVFWIVNPGQDPVKLFEKYGNRFELMHLKDMKKGTPQSFTGTQT